MVNPSPFGATAFCDGFSPGVAPPEQFAYFRPRASWAQPLHRGLLNRVEVLVACGQFLACFEGGATSGKQVFDGCDFGDFRLQGLRERICHEVRVEVNTPVLNSVLTDPQGQVFNSVQKRTALHRPKPQQPLHRPRPTNENGPSSGTPLPGQGLTNRF